ncbi:MAG: hypothetical protein M1835_006457 [Candelina submexicana]|nr:MAG: hypothetical protein M1835_006457 [Candelina submexicana]
MKPSGRPARKTPPNVETRRAAAARALLPGDFHPFLRLPPELRNQIYQYHITSHNIAIPLKNRKRAKRFVQKFVQKPPPAILRVNRQILKEARPLLYDLPIEFTYAKDMPDITALFSIADLQHFRDVTVHVNVEVILNLSPNMFKSPVALLSIWHEAHRLRRLVVHFETTNALSLHRLFDPLHGAITFVNALRGLRGVQTVEFWGVHGQDQALEELRAVMRSPKVDGGEEARES